MNRLPLIVSCLALLVVGGGALALWLRRPAPEPLNDQPPVHFSLRDTAGRPVSEADLAGSAALVYFGYTFCPDICPGELGWMVRVLAALGPDAQRVRPVFISVDPERDTPEKLAAYARLFDERILALTGDPAALKAAGDACGAVWRRAEVVTQQPGYYLIDHTLTTILLDRHGRVAARISSRTTSPEAAATLIRNLP
jgi:protein SCO1/2